MMRKQEMADSLSIRRETAAVLADVLDGRRHLAPVHESTASRWCTGECGNPLEYTVRMVRDLPDSEAAQIVAVVEDAYAGRHGEREQPGSLEAAWLAMDAADSEQDQARMRCAIDGADASELRAFIRASREQQRANERARRWAVRELHRREPRSRPMRPRSGREARSA